MTSSTAFERLFIGRSPELMTVLRTAQVAAAADVTALILGESGTGKELLAQAIHEHSRRANGPFIAINCAALPEGLVESELFGHARGAFTGAADASGGRVGAANGGTLFLDEVGELPLAVQAKLLRFLESGECQPVGRPTPVRVDVRLVAATNRDLMEAVRAGRFREDLYYRLHVVPLTLPPLRERPGDLPVLLDGLTARVAEGHGLARPRFAPAALAALARHSWPGNVRELRNFCERMVVLHAGAVVDAADLPAEIVAPAPKPGASALPPLAFPDGGLNLADLEERVIAMALQKARGNRSKAARLLGLTRDTLLYRMKKYAIEA